MASIGNRLIPGPAGKIKIRIYSPSGEGPFPVPLYFHGGGFVIADLDTYDATPRALCNAVPSVVVSVHYRQGPEHKFPAAHDDAFAAYEWVVEHSGEIKSGAGRVALVGESAGANLAVSVAMAARDGNLSAPSYQVLVYPVVDSDTETTSYRINAHAKPLNRAMLKWFFAHETASADAHDSRLVPLHANLSNLPPSTVITAQIDPLPSEGDAFAQRLSEHGVPVRYRHYNGVTHEFFWHGGGFARGERGAGGCGRRFAVGAGRRNDGNLIGGEGNYFDVREAR